MRSRSRFVWVLLVPATLALTPAGSTVGLFRDAKAGQVSFSAAGASPPSVPGNVAIHVLVGDLCTDAPIATVTNYSRWSMSVSVTADGWLTHPASVSVSPSSLGPGESATIAFTKAAVQGPFPITGNIYVTANPGGFTQTITLSGEVGNPAGAATPGYEPPPGCVTTPRPKGLKTTATGGLEFPEGTKLLPSGNFQLPDGSVVSATGDVVVGSGSPLVEGGVEIPAGVTVGPDGTLVGPDGKPWAPAPAPSGEAPPAPAPAAPVPAPEAPPVPAPAAPVPAPEAPEAPTAGA